MGYLSVLEHKAGIASSSRPRHPLDGAPPGLGTPPAGAGDREGREAGWGPSGSKSPTPTSRPEPLSGAGVRPRLRLPDYYGPGQHAHRLGAGAG